MVNAIIIKCTPIRIHDVLIINKKVKHILMIMDKMKQIEKEMKG